MLRIFSPILVIAICSFLVGCGDKPGRELPKTPPADGKIFKRSEGLHQESPKPPPSDDKVLDRASGPRDESPAQELRQ